MERKVNVNLCVSFILLQFFSLSGCFFFFASHFRWQIHRLLCILTQLCMTELNKSNTESTQFRLFLYYFFFLSFFFCLSADAFAFEFEFEHLNGKFRGNASSEHSSSSRFWHVFSNEWEAYP